MYNILIVDDEPFICEGLTRLLAESGISIGHIYNAHSGYEALDYLRMEEIDLMITDIQMGSMNGIELMGEARLIKPWVQTIIISAHETFQYAQMAIRLGAKDYLIKPLNPDQVLDSVRNVLLKMVKPAAEEDQFLSAMEEHFRMKAPLPERDQLLNELLEAAPERAKTIAEGLRKWGIVLNGPYYSVMRLRLKGADQGRNISSEADKELLKYAALNIASELLDREWSGVLFYSPGDEISIILQWSESQFNESGVGKLEQLDMIGRSLHYNIGKFLNIGCIVGISQLLKGEAFLKELAVQAGKAGSWHRRHPDHFVFYYGDFNWSGDYEEEPSSEEINAQNSLIVEKAKGYIDNEYARKGLTLHEVAQKNHVSPNYLSYLFKKETGFNLWEYVIKLRMEESKRLLLQTDLRRYEISDKVGYESPEHFSKIFKKYYGMSPSELKLASGGGK